MIGKGIEKFDIIIILYISNLNQKLNNKIHKIGIDKAKNKTKPYVYFTNIF